LGIPRRTVSNFLQRLATRENKENLPRSGRPRKTSKSDDRYLAYEAEADTEQKQKELRDITNIAVSIQTIRRRLREAGIRKWYAEKRALLNKRQAAERLEWAREHRHWARDDFDKVLWTDESLVKKDNDCRRKRVFRRQNTTEKYAPKNIQGKKKGGGPSQMVWGCFVGNRLGPLFMVENIIKKEVYIHLLAESLLPFIDLLHEEGIHEVIFQQVNASSHTAAITSKWLKTMAQQLGFTIMQFPVNSPDLNPIENVWAHLKTELYRRYPDTMYLKGPPNTIKQILQDRLNEIWWDIGEDLLDTLIDSMPGRVQTVIKARGWYTDK
jgi:transposase